MLPTWPLFPAEFATASSISGTQTARTMTVISPSSRHHCRKRRLNIFATPQVAASVISFPKRRWSLPWSPTPPRERSIVAPFRARLLLLVSRKIDPLFETRSLLPRFGSDRSRQCFEQNCLCANRWRIRPKLPLHIAQRVVFAFLCGVVTSSVIVLLIVSAHWQPGL